MTETIPMSETEARDWLRKRVVLALEELERPRIVTGSANAAAHLRVMLRMLAANEEEAGQPEPVQAQVQAPSVDKPRAGTPAGGWQPGLSYDPAKVAAWEEHRRKNKLRRERLAAERPEVLRKDKDYQLRRAYGMTVEQYEAMVVKQDGGCAVCGMPDMPLHVDHDHDTGEVRALLCPRCNGMLGLAGDNPVILGLAVAYLDAHGRALPQGEAQDQASPAKPQAGNISDQDRALLREIDFALQGVQNDGRSSAERTALIDTLLRLRRRLHDAEEPHQTPRPLSIYDRLVRCLDDALAHLDSGEARPFIEGARIMAQSANMHGLHFVSGHDRPSEQDQPSERGSHAWTFLGGQVGPQGIRDLYQCKDCGAEARFYRLSFTPKVETPASKTPASYQDDGA